MTAELADVTVVGAGLIGTSLGLALRDAGVRVRLRDPDAARLAAAAARGAGEPDEHDHDRPPDLIVVAVPPARCGTVCVELLRSEPSATITHVASVQSLPQAQVEAQESNVTRFVGSHPVAGRERAGPMNAAADLFRDQPWVVCPAAATGDQARAAAHELARLCGGHAVEMDADTHDRVLARVSHAPQFVASALAAALLPLGPDEVALAGSGLRDTTRLADSDPQLWGEIAAANAANLASALEAVAAPLADLARALREAPDAASAERLVAAGRLGRGLLPGKHGGATVPVVGVQVVTPDEPGALAALLTRVAGLGINVEDIRLEHATGALLGSTELLVAPADAPRLVAGLRAGGWFATGDVGGGSQPGSPG
jgi:prephenate dehydrogenase